MTRLSLFTQSTILSVSALVLLHQIFPHTAWVALAALAVVLSVLGLLLQASHPIEFYFTKYDWHAAGDSGFILDIPRHIVQIRDPAYARIYACTSGQWARKIDVRIEEFNFGQYYYIHSDNKFDGKLVVKLLGA